MISRRLALLRTLARIGPRRVALVAQHRRRLKSGYYETACSVRDWGDITYEGRSPFHHPDASELAADPDLIADADRILDGEIRYFSWKWLPKPETWKSNPANGYETQKVHWAKLKDFAPEQGDIKWIWEPSRFDWAVTLGRAYARTKDERYRAKFAELLTDWRANNRPNEGINWFCAQECALRLLALVWAAAAFDVELTNLKSKIWSTVAALAERIEPTLGYAIGQHNNHGISEAMGLYLAGHCVDHPRSKEWRHTGRTNLIKLIDEQFAEDGSYVQHSFVYQRLAIRCCLTCFSVARGYAEPFPAAVEAKILTAGKFLRALMVDDATGRLPNYGANDGANILALSSCEYLDMRPVIQLAHAVIADEDCFGDGPWREELAWYGAAGKPLKGSEPVQRVGKYAARDGGYYLLRQESQTQAFIRVPHYTDGRPSQADALHVDIWMDGAPVAIDSGTYSYNDPSEWWKYFKSTDAHNTVTVDSLDQMPSAGRFLFTDWTKAEVTTWEHDFIAAVSYAYRQIGLGVTHYRTVYAGAGWVVVRDRLVGPNRHRYELTWHLHGKWRAEGERTIGPNGIELQVTGTPVVTELVLSEKAPPRACQSLRYGELLPASLLVAAVEAPRGVDFVSVFKSKHADSGVLAHLQQPTLHEGMYVGTGKDGG